MLKLKNKQLSLGKILGTEVLIHWSFGIVIAIMALVASDPYFLALIISVHLSVFLHEWGHVLMGRRLGYKTPTITLTAIGGVAAMQMRPVMPWRETFWITAAGPAVNVVLAVLFGILWLLSGSTILYGMALGQLILVVFNLLPIYPMDGGRLASCICSVICDNFADAQYAKFVFTTVNAILVGLAFAYNGHAVGLAMMFAVWFFAKQQLSVEASGYEYEQRVNARKEEIKAAGRCLKKRHDDEEIFRVRAEKPISAMTEIDAVGHTVRR